MVGTTRAVAPKGVNVYSKMRVISEVMDGKEINQ